MARPLEDRFPTLYYDIVGVRDHKTLEVEEHRTRKQTPPTLIDAIGAILTSHRVHPDGALTADLARSIVEFLEPPMETKSAKARKRAADEDE